MKFRTFYYEYLEKKPLYVIRELGRVIGVKAPASKKKDLLIREIIAIQKGELYPVFQKGKGAPPKYKIDLSEFLEPEKEIDFSSIFPKLPPEAPTTDNGPETYKFIDDDEDEERGLVYRDVNADTEIIEGILELHPKGFGFIRTNNYENSPNDGYISGLNIMKYALRKGDKLKVRVKVGSEENGCPPTQDVLEVNDLPPRSFIARRNFDDLIPDYPRERLTLSKNNDSVDLRLIDLFSPIGKGQRGLIVAPPKTGKTTLIKNIAKAIETNYPDVKVIVLLIDERPEEVTDIKKSLTSEVVYSTFDERTEHHVRAAELVINRAKRLVEIGKDVVVLLDSITRLTRAYNACSESSGKTLSGGLEAQALIGPKRFFGSARNADDGGSLTIIATALIDTGSRLDDVIFEEFKGTGNMEINLSRDLSERRVFPAVDIFKSGTRKDELLLTEDELNATAKIRSMLSNNVKATELVIDLIKKTKDNEDFVKKTDAFIKVYEK